MSAPTVEFQEDYLQAYTLKSWLLTTDHKRIGLLYMASITFFFFVGGAAATIMRLELMTPQGDVLSSPDAYNRDRKSTRLNSSHLVISYAVFCLKKKKNTYL